MYAQTHRATLDGLEQLSCHLTQSPASSPVQTRKGRVQELLQRREVRDRGLCMPLQLHLGMSHCKPTAMPREHLLSGWLCPLTQSDWLGDRGKPASVCLRAVRRRGRAVFPHLCLWKCQNRHLALLPHTAPGGGRRAGTGGLGHRRAGLGTASGRGSVAQRCPFGCAQVHRWGWTTLLGQPWAFLQDITVCLASRTVFHSSRHLFY